MLFDLLFQRQPVAVAQTGQAVYLFDQQKSGFVKLIKMVAGLIVFLTVVTGFTGMKKGAGLGRMGATALIYFEIVSTVALILGMILANIFQPGKGLALHAEKAGALSVPATQPPSTVDFLLGIIPKTAVDALASGVMLQVLLVAVLFGYALFALGDKAKPVNDFLGIMSEATFKVVGVILNLHQLAYSVPLRLCSGNMVLVRFCR